MVLEANKQFHAVNKCVISYINNTNILTDEQKKNLIEEWKRTTGSKLKSSMNKTKPKVPKRVTSKYIYFCTDERPRILKENPEMNINDCTRMMGTLWKEFQANPDPVRMEKYTKLFEADQLRYEKDKRELQDAASSIVDADIVEKPKKPESAYLNYCAERRKTEPSISMKVLSMGWKEVKSDPDQLALYTPKRDTTTISGTC